MLNIDLIDVVNSGTAWALVGSGASSDAGAPSWRRLVESVLERLEPSHQAELAADARFADAFGKSQFPRALQRVQAVAGRARLIAAVAEELDPHRLTPGPLHRHIASWPFAGYFTSNYDELLERALAMDDPGWIGVGNTADELRKLSGGARKTVWHFHGSVQMPSTKSRLVLTEADYDEFYLEDSAVRTHLRAFFQLHRLVFFGFGFADEELLRLLRITARYCTPVRPAFAFLAGVSDADRTDMRERFNVEVVPLSMAM
jgi:hypothetical protein